MYQTLLADASFFEFLFRCDRDLAEKAREGGCLECGGVLHRADYLRRPRGEPRGLDKELALRYSFCCAGEGCRKRHTPPSLRFLGRRIYLGAVVVLVSVMRDGPSATRLERLQELVGASARTVRRWRRWWKEELPQSRVWREIRGRLDRPVDEQALPGSLLERLLGTTAQKVEALLRLLGPLTSPVGQVF